MARDRLSEYLEAVGAQIRWKRARRPLLRELSDHIADQAAAFSKTCLLGTASRIPWLVSRCSTTGKSFSCRTAYL